MTARKLAVEQHAAEHFVKILASNNEVMEEKNKRNIPITIKVSESDIERLKALSSSCGMPVSSYMREAALRKVLRCVLTEKETKLLENLMHCRGDIIKFSNAYSGLSSERRRLIFQNTTALQEWLDILMRQAEEIQNFLDNVGRRAKR